MKAAAAIVVGAGWAGLSAAIQLAQAGISVTLLEAAPNSGGRARSISFDNYLVDNGQHIFIGAYHNTLQLLHILGIPETQCFFRHKHRLLMHDLIRNETAFDLKIPNLFSPLHFIMALLLEKNLSMRDRLRALRFCRTLQALDFQLQEELTVLELLKTHHQTPALIETFWNPIALATLSTPIEIASAQIFLQVLHKAFTQNIKNSDFLFPKFDLSEVLPNPANDYLKKHGSSILYHQRVNALLVENNRCIGVQTNKGIYNADYIILATPPHNTAALLRPIPQTIHLGNNLADFNYQPITTIYVKYPIPVNLPLPMMGVLNGRSQWIFDRKFANQPEVISVVITADSELKNFNHKQNVVNTIVEEIAKIFPHLPKPTHTKVITEKYAAFSCTVNIHTKRPNNLTPITNLFLAGDYTNTGYPATIEGAVTSGFSAASLVTTALCTEGANV